MFRKRKDKTKKAETSNVEAAPTSPVTRDEIALYAYYIRQKGRTSQRPCGGTLASSRIAASCSPPIGHASSALSQAKPIAVELGRLFSSFSILLDGRQRTRACVRASRLRCRLHRKKRITRAGSRVRVKFSISSPVDEMSR